MKDAPVFVRAVAAGARGRAGDDAAVVGAQRQRRLRRAAAGKSASERGGTGAEDA